MNRFKIILGACGIHLCIGSVYSWSVLTHPIMELTGWQLTNVTFAFSLAILFLGLSAGFLGHKVQEWGVRKSGEIATACFVTGLLGSALALIVKSITLLYICYGFIGGIGLGIGYITPVATLLKVFPEKKGFAGGCAVMSFGFASMIAGPLMQYLNANFGVIHTLCIMAIVYNVIMLTSVGLIYHNLPYNMVNNRYAAELENVHEINESTKTVNFALLWTIFFINISCGIALLSIASPMAEHIGMNAVEAAGMVGVIGLINGGGRIFFASISDYIGRGITYSLFFLIEIIAFYMLISVDNILLFQSIIFVIVACYGGGFSCMPAYIADIFGTKNLSAIHGRILTAWGIAGIVGPLVITNIYEIFGNYSIALGLFSGLFALSFILSVILIKHNR